MASVPETETSIDPKMARAMRFTVYLQVPLWLITLCMLDFGQANRACSVAILSYWILVAIITYRHRQSPTRCDLLVARFGFIPIFAVTAFAQHWRTSYAIAHPYFNF